MIWTKHKGEDVRWDQPPHYVDGVLELRLGDEQLSMDEIAKRNREFMKLRRRSLK